MPLDPSIIGSYNPGAGVNVNALMQQQMQGMENINALERQRQADALAMEDRAVLQQEKAAMADEKAMIEALLPAYTYGIETGDMAGALSLVPPDMQEGILPYVQALEGKSPEQVRAALIGSLSTSKAGQEALAAMQRAQTAQIQMGQLDVSRANAKREAEAAARGPKPEFEIREVEGLGFVRINRATGEVFPITYPDTTAAGGGIPGPRAEPVPEPTTTAPISTQSPTTTAPISTQQPPKERVLQPKAKADKEITQEERRRAASLRYAVANADRVAEVIAKDPKAFGQGADEFLLSIVPFDMGKDFLQFTQDANREQVYYRMTQTVATLLRLATGAAFTSPEIVTESASYMPKYGDEPETARDKLDALQDRVASEIGSTGRAWTPQDQAEYDAAMMAIEAMKDRLYPAGGGAAAPSASDGEIDTSNPLLQD